MVPALIRKEAAWVQCAVQALFALPSVGVDRGRRCWAHFAIRTPTTSPSSAGSRPTGCVEAWAMRRPCLPSPAWGRSRAALLGKTSRTRNPQQRRPKRGVATHGLCGGLDVRPCLPPQRGVDRGRRCWALRGPGTPTTSPSKRGVATHGLCGGPDTVSVEAALQSRPDPFRVAAQRNSVK